MGNFYGQWQVNDKIFSNRKEAILYASSIDGEIKWLWHNSVWENFNKELLGKVALQQLYKERAQQLRDNYDYLILSYSGGADSHNVLMSFINNNIKLDQIFVHMPFNVINSQIHTPNTQNKSARNLLSEWDYVIKPTLEWLSVTHPEIKIELSDWTDNISENILKSDLLHFTTDVWGLGNLARSLDYSKIGLDQLNKGKRVATVYGADKPIVIKDNNKSYMSFIDRPLLLAANNNNPVELFYWTPDMPHLAYEMAYQVYLYFLNNVHLQKFMWQKNMSVDFDTALSINDSIAKSVCYSDTWDFTKFQAEKPIQSGIGKDRDWYIYELDEFSRERDAWQYYFTDFYQGVDKKYLGKDNQSNKIKTKGFYLGDMEIKVY